MFTKNSPFSAHKSTELLPFSFPPGTPHLSTTYLYFHHLLLFSYPYHDHLSSSLRLLTNSFNFSFDVFTLFLGHTPTQRYRYYINPILQFTHAIFEPFHPHPVTLFQYFSNIRTAHVSLSLLPNSSSKLAHNAPLFRPCLQPLIHFGLKVDILKFFILT